MLVLTRRAGEFIYLLFPDGSKIMVTVSKVDGCNVRIGLDAPNDVRILRGPEFIDEEGNLKDPKRA